MAGLRFNNADLGLRFLYPRRWRVAGGMGRQVRLDGADGTLTLHIERCTFANWDGADLKRPITSLTADELKYTNPAASVGGATELVWKRVK